MKTFIILAVLAIVAGMASFIEPAAVGSIVSNLSIVPPHAGELTMAIIAGGLLSPQDLEREAVRTLSFYEGSKKPPVLNFYTGSDDDLLSFEGDIASFAAELDENLDKQFSISLVNANAATRIPVLFAGYKKGNGTLAPGQVVEGAFNDKNAAAGLTGATQEQKSIEELFLFLNNVPTRLLALKLQSTVAGQLNQNLTYQRNSPWKTEATETIRPKNWVNQNSFHDDQVVFPVKKQLDALAYLELPIVGTSTAFITYYFGASLNIIQALEKKAARADMNIKIAGAKNVVDAQRRQLGMG